MWGRVRWLDAGLGGHLQVAKRTLQTFNVVPKLAEASVTPATNKPSDDAGFVVVIHDNLKVVEVPFTIAALVVLDPNHSIETFRMESVRSVNVSPS